MYEVEHLGETLFIGTEKLKRELDSLTKINQKNIQLLKEKIRFDLCLMERPHLSARTRLAFLEARSDMYLDRESMRSTIVTKHELNFYSSSNVVVFANCLHDCVKISKFTRNAPAFFGTTSSLLRGADTKLFMPPSVAAVHNHLVMNYLNGSSVTRQDGNIQAPFKSLDGNYSSVTMYFKLEYHFTDDIYIGVVVVVRKKNVHPMIYTDASGAIIGSNRHMTALLQGEGIEKYSLFTMIPRLFPYYFPRLSRDSINPVTLLAIQQTTDKNVQNMDCFLFKMLNKATAEPTPFVRTSEHGYNKGNLYITESKKLWDKVSRYVHLTKHYANNHSVLLKTFFDHSPKIVANTDSIMKFTLNIECHRYQQQLEIRELCLSDFHNSGPDAQVFFRYHCKQRFPYLVELMSLGPETIKNFFKLLRAAMPSRVYTSV